MTMLTIARRPISRARKLNLYSELYDWARATGKKKCAATVAAAMDRMDAAQKREDEILLAAAFMGTRQVVASLN